MIPSITAELLVLRKRPAIWILLGIWTLLAVTFAYVVPYASGTPAGQLSPATLATTPIFGFPFFGGVFALMLGVLGVGSDFSWDTWKTLLVQRPGRLHVLGAKLAALAVAAAGFVISVFLAGGVASLVIATTDGLTITAPDGALLLRSLATGWLVLTVWTAAGALLAMLSRGTSLAIGVGIVYTLVVEGLLSVLAAQVSWLDGLVAYLVRANAYSLIVGWLDVPPRLLADLGPGSYFGPFVSGTHGALVLAAYAIILLGASALLLRQRDVL